MKKPAAKMPAVASSWLVLVAELRLKHRHYSGIGILFARA